MTADRMVSTFLTVNLPKYLVQICRPVSVSIAIIFPYFVANITIFLNPNVSLYNNTEVEFVAVLLSALARIFPWDMELITEIIFDYT